MPPVPQPPFGRRVRVRRLRRRDYEAVIELQRLCFPGMSAWMREQFESQQRLFPEGQVGIEIDGRLVASSCSLIVDFSHYTDWHNWKEIADSGYIRNHDPAGDTLYGIEIQVHPEFRGMKLARRLYDARKRLVRERNLARIIIGGRIPGYAPHADKLSAQQYVDQVVRKDLYDPVLTAQLANGFVLKRLIPDYFPSDDASRGWATFLEWANIDHVADQRQRYTRISTVRLCCVQYEMRPVKDFAEFARQVEFFADVASDQKSDFVVYPELITTQLLSTVKARSPEQAVRKLVDSTPRYLELFSGLAIKYNVNIVGGSAFTFEGERLRNTGYLFRRDGSVATQHKLHVTPNERRWWGVQPGDALHVLDTDRGRVAVLLGYDVEFPELARVAAARDADLIFVPFNTDQRVDYLRVRYCAQARAVENHQCVVLAGCVGNLPQVAHADVHYSESGVFTPSDIAFPRDGIAAQCAPNVETVLVCEVDLEQLRRHRLSGTVRNWVDRRADLYRVRYLGGPRPEDL